MSEVSRDTREVVQCDYCGFNQVVPSEAHAIVYGWSFTSEGTKCVECAGKGAS